MTLNLTSSMIQGLVDIKSDQFKETFQSSKMVKYLKDINESRSVISSEKDVSKIKIKHIPEK